MEGILVHPHARGEGIGNKLLAALDAEGRARGYAELRLEVIEENTRARALYEREGFSAVASQSTGLLRWVFGFRGATTMVRRVA